MGFELPTFLQKEDMRRFEELKEIFPDVSIEDIEKEIDILEALKIKFPHRVEQFENQIDLHKDAIYIKQGVYNPLKV